jgi:hypothetical protein
MAYVARRKNGRFEIRESVTTPTGPRSRSLATFGTLTDDVLDRAVARAQTPFDRAAVRLAARRAGAEVALRPVDDLAARLLAELARGERPTPALTNLLVAALTSDVPPGDSPDQPLPDLVRWIAASAEERGQTVRELLGLADAFPAWQRPERSAFPRFGSERPA